MAKVRIALIGLGKMGISHVAILRAHPDVELVAVCDPQGFVLDGISKYTGLKTYRQFTDLLANETLHGVVVATPSRFHDDIVRAALEQDLAVFCEKPFSLDAKVALELAELAEGRGLINHVGYHYRHVAAFREAKRLLDSGVIGKVHHLRAEAYGPVVLRPNPAGTLYFKLEGKGGETALPRQWWGIGAKPCLSACQSRVGQDQADLPAPGVQTVPAGR